MDIFEEKRKNSIAKLNDLKSKIAASGEVIPFSNLAIFVTGSYARDEASVHSDIDLFFVNSKSVEGIVDHNINSVQLFSRIISISREMNFPKFSNDGAYLKIIENPKILALLGGPDDDHMNYFTARLLLILESKPVFGSEEYRIVLESILNSYFKDYPDHTSSFRPTFLVNDIIRFWKTLCLNYENKRNQPIANDQKITAQKIRNLKLKFSRMLTCFGSIAHIASIPHPVDVAQIMKMTEISPLHRLRGAVGNDEERILFEKAVEQYRWFLQLTNVSETELMSYFANKPFYKDAFIRADEFGQSIFEITKAIAERNGYLRFLLV